EEGGLEGVLGVLVTAENPAADAPDHRAVPADQGRQRCLVPAAEKSLQQLPVGPVRPVAQEYRPAQVLKDFAHRAGRHVDSSLSRGGRSLPLSLPARGRIDTRLPPVFSEMRPSGSGPVAPRALTVAARTVLTGRYPEKEKARGRGLRAEEGVRQSGEDLADRV